MAEIEQKKNKTKGPKRILKKLKNMKNLVFYIFILSCFLAFIPWPISQIDIQREPDDFLRVMTFNAHFGVSSHGEYNLVEIEDTIKQYSPDIVGFQEVGVFTLTNGYMNMMADLTGRMEALGYEHYIIAEPENFVLTNAIFSRYPIENATTVAIEPKVLLERNAIVAEINVSGNIVVLVNTHVTHIYEEETNPERVEQIDFLLNKIEEINNQNYPQILMGDFNSEPDWEEIKKILGQNYTDTFTAANPEESGYTWSALNASKRIDYIFSSSDFVVDDSVVIDITTSDHFPMYSDLKLEN